MVAPSEHAADPPSVPRAPTGAEAAAFALLVGAGVAMRAAEALRTPLWCDEIYILDVVHRPLRAALALVRADIHPPLTFLLRWAWLPLADHSDFGQKLLSLLIAAGALWAAGRLATRMFGPRAGLLALALVAVNAAHAHYSQEVEDYGTSWLLLLVTITAAWDWARQRRRSDLAAFAVSGTLALYNHYLAIGVLLVLAAWGFVRLRGDRGARRTWALACAGIAVAFAPQVGALAAQFAREGAGSFFHFPGLAETVRLWRAAAPGVPALALVYGGLALLPLMRRATRPAALLLWLLIVLPLLEKRLWVIILPREGLLVVSLVAALAAAGVAALPGRALRLAVAAVLVAFGLRAWTHHAPNPEAVALGRMERVIRAGARPGDVIVNAEMHSLLYFRWHLPGMRERLLTPGGGRVPYFDAGLVVPDSLLLTPAGFDSLRRAGTSWWGAEVDRAYVTRNVVSRAGQEGIRALEAAPRDSAWDAPPARVLRGSSR